MSSPDLPIDLTDKFISQEDIHSKACLERQWEEYVDSFEEPIKKEAWATDGLWRLVGNGEVTSASCGAFKGFIGCVNDEKHSRMTLEGKHYSGLALVRLKHKSCFSYDCPVCYLSWAVKGAHRITDKLESLGVKYGVADHIVLSLPKGYFSSTDTNFDKICKKIVKALQLRGVVAGCYITHGFRYASSIEALEKNVKQGWRWSMHFHILGFIRNKKQFYKDTADFYHGFYYQDQNNKWHEEKGDQFLVKLKDKRESVFGTAFYQLNHASIMPGQKMFNVARWFGEVTDPRSKKMRENSKIIKSLKYDTSIEAVKEIFQLQEENRQLKKEVKIVLNKVHVQKCPICNSPLVELTYYGLRKDLERSLIECKGARLPNLTYWDKSKIMFLDKIINEEEGIVNWLPK